MGFKVATLPLEGKLTRISEVTESKFSFGGKGFQEILNLVIEDTNGSELVLSVPRERKAGTILNEIAEAFYRGERVTFTGKTKLWSFQNWSPFFWFPKLVKRQYHGEIKMEGFEYNITYSEIIAGSSQVNFDRFEAERIPKETGV